MRHPIAHPKLLYHIALSGKMQQEIAARAGISKVRFSAIMRGRRDPTPSERRHLAIALDVPVEDLFPDLYGDESDDPFDVLGREFAASGTTEQRHTARRSAAADSYR